MRYLAAVCPHCGRASAVRADAKRHQCPYCGRVYEVERTTIIAAGNAKEVRQAVVRHNAERA
ncbi:MAG: DUF1922 domain-containing protein [Pyrobaculum sp.]